MPRGFGLSLIANFKTDRLLGVKLAANGEMTMDQLKLRYKALTVRGNPGHGGRVPGRGVPAARSECIGIAWIRRPTLEGIYSWEESAWPRR